MAQFCNTRSPSWMKILRKFVWREDSSGKCSALNLRRFRKTHMAFFLGKKLECKIEQVEKSVFTIFFMKNYLPKRLGHANPTVLQQVHVSGEIVVTKPRKIQPFENNITNMTTSSRSEISNRDQNNCVAFLQYIEKGRIVRWHRKEVLSNLRENAKGLQNKCFQSMYFQKKISQSCLFINHVFFIFPNRVSKNRIWGDLVINFKVNTWVDTQC